MRYGEGDDLVVAIAHDAVSTVAPDELAWFGAVAEAYQRNPKRASPRAAKDDPLGFGLDAAVPLVAWVAIAVATGALESMGQDLERSVIARMRAALRRLMRRLRGRRPENSTNRLRPLSPDQLATIREQAVRKARQLDLDENRAELLADAIVGSLAARGL